MIAGGAIVGQGGFSTTRTLMAKLGQISETPDQIPRIPSWLSQKVKNSQTFSPDDGCREGASYSRHLTYSTLDSKVRLRSSRVHLHSCTDFLGRAAIPATFADNQSRRWGLLPFSGSLICVDRCGRCRSGFEHFYLSGILPRCSRQWSGERWEVRGWDGGPLATR